MRVPDGHVPVPLEEKGFCTNCSRFKAGGVCLENEAGLTHLWPCYDNAAIPGRRVKVCIFAVATPENIARSVAWRLSK